MNTDFYHFCRFGWLAPIAVPSIDCHLNLGCSGPYFIHCHISHEKTLFISPKHIVVFGYKSADVVHAPSSVIYLMQLHFLAISIRATKASSIVGVCTIAFKVSKLLVLVLEGSTVPLSLVKFLFCLNGVFDQ